MSFDFAPAACSFTPALSGLAVQPPIALAAFLGLHAPDDGPPASGTAA